MFGESSASDHSCILAIGAHPDDVVISVGGTLAQLSDAGHRIVILTLSSGGLGGNPALREAEESEAARRLGATLEFGHLDDGELAHRCTVRIIDQIVSKYRPVLAFVHSADDTHQDHIVAYEAARVSCRKVPTLFSYESPSSRDFHPTTVLDVTNTWPRKLHALEAHASQLTSRRLLSWVDAAARFRSWPRHVGGMCEAFRLCHTDALPALIGLHPAPDADASAMADFVAADADVS